MRLGDLDALKKTFTEECCGCCDNCSHCMTGYKCELIYNAPTVNTGDCEGCPYCPNSNSGIPIGVE